VLETELRRKETNWKRLSYVQPNSSSAWHTGLSGGAPDSVRCARLVNGEEAALGSWRSCTTIIHWTVLWCTGLSGESSAANSSFSGKDQSDVAIIHRTVRWANCASANGRLHDQRATRGLLQRSAGCTGLSGVHRTVSSVPTSPEEQRSDAPDLEGDRAPYSYSDYPVVHRTVRCTTRQKAGIAFQVGLQRLLAALGL
jgi:hypothetical protein